MKITFWTLPLYFLFLTMVHLMIDYAVELWRERNKNDSEE